MNVPSKVLICLLVGLLPAVAVAQDRAARDRASLALNEGRYFEAISILTDVVAADSSSVDAFLLRARAYEGQGSYDRAIGDYRQVLRLAPDHEEARRGLRRTRDRLRTHLVAEVETRRRLAEANPNSLPYRLRYADALYEAGSALHDAGYFRQAADTYEAYLDQTQGTPDVVQRYLISIAGYPGDNLRGERAAERYLLLYPTSDDLYMRLGYFRLWQHKRALAEQAFRQALLLNPGNRDARLGLDGLRNPGAVRQASPYPIDVLLRDLAANPDQDAKRFELVDLLVEAGRYFEARQHLDRLAARHRTGAEWQRLSDLVNRRLKAAPGPAGPGFIVDRLLRELKANPDQDDKRFRLVSELLRFKRYAEAYDHLVTLKDRQGRTLADKYGDTARWRDLFARVDRSLPLRDAHGKPVVYLVDRYMYRLRLDPADAATRYALADELMAGGRVLEAYDVLADPRYARPEDPAYQRRLASLTDARNRYLAGTIETLETHLKGHPDDLEAFRQLPDLYLLDNRPDDALAAFERLLERDPAVETQVRYVTALRQTGAADRAVAAARRFLARQPEHPRLQRAYALAAMDAGLADPDTDALVRAVLEATPDDPDLLLAVAAYRLGQGRLADADTLVRRADAVAPAAYESRIETLNQLLAREQVRAREAERQALLDEARRHAADGNYALALARYEAYFEARGQRTRAELKEVAQVHTAAHDFAAALSILKALQAQAYEYDVEKEIAKNQFYRHDFTGTVRTLEPLLEANPDDYEVRLLLSDAYRELGRFARARAVYREADSTTVDSRVVETRTTQIELGSRAALAQSGEWRGFDYVGLIVPTSDATVARGGGTRYSRWAQGLQTQVTLPAPVVLTAGVNSHFLSGTRRLVPGSETVRGRVNQIFAGGFIDFKPPVPSVKASYTSRLSAQIGLFDYEGGRTVPFGGLRYWHQVPGQFAFSIGARTTEGSIDLWSPGGGEFDLRLTQLDVRGATASLLPDSLLKLNARLALNIVRDDFGNTATSNDTNVGTNIQIDAGYRVFPYTYLGVTYYQIDYRTTVDLYFSPRNYETYDLWLEYEREVRDQWYFRLRGSVGIVARSSGFVSRRIEAEWVYRLASRLSLTMLGAIGQSTRSLGSSASAFDRYNTFTFSGALYWTL